MAIFPPRINVAGSKKQFLLAAEVGRWWAGSPGTKGFSGVASTCFQCPATGIARQRFQRRARSFS